MRTTCSKFSTFVVCSRLQVKNKKAPSLLKNRLTYYST
nr:MAG TPA: hypothetical protein [Herelleviridae sp.]